MRDVFDLPDLGAMDDGIANGTYEAKAGEAQPLSLFTAARVDYSLHRLRHYSGTAPEWFQNFVLFTNYQFYIDEFVRLGHEAMTDENSEYIAFIEPGNVITRRRGLAAGSSSMYGELLDGTQGTPPPRLPQMPGYHLVREDCTGISMVNIGVGPANAKTITDHVAVLRPHAWVMLGHCAGLRRGSSSATTCSRMPMCARTTCSTRSCRCGCRSRRCPRSSWRSRRRWPRSPARQGTELKKIMRTGTVASTDNRNWELLPGNQPQRALQPEPGGCARHGKRHHRGQRLPLPGALRHAAVRQRQAAARRDQAAGMANQFYRERVEQHLRIGMAAIDILRQEGSSRLHSRKLRSFAGSGFPVGRQGRTLRPARTAPASRARPGRQGQRPAVEILPHPAAAQRQLQAGRPSAPPRWGRRSLQSRQAQAEAASGGAGLRHVQAQALERHRTRRREHVVAALGGRPQPVLGMQAVVQRHPCAAGHVVIAGARGAQPAGCGRAELAARRAGHHQQALERGGHLGTREPEIAVLALRHRMDQPLLLEGAPGARWPWTARPRRRWRVRSRCGHGRP